jgi:hypothetical protein
MSETKEIFYNLFWQSQACKNLFLLSKEELLDTKAIEIEDASASVSFPRIIVSNVIRNDDNHEKIRFRTEANIIKSENSISNKLKFYEPLISNFIESKFGKALEKFAIDFNQSPTRFLKLTAKIILSNDVNREKIIIQELQNYGFIGKHIKAFDQLEKYISKEGVNKNLKALITEENVWNLFEFLKAAKDIYTNQVYKDFYSSNQILVNSLNKEDNFENRLKLFNHLFESGVLYSSLEDSYLECTHCNPGVFRGILQLKLNPLKLRNLKCPGCENALTYYVPYELHPDIYNVIKSKDGLLLDAFCHYLLSKKVFFQCNVIKLTDIEFDCIISLKEKITIVECKMYKLNTTKERLTSKLKEHFSRLVGNVMRVKEYDPAKTVLVLLVNIPDQELLEAVTHDVKNQNEISIFQAAMILNIHAIERIA